MKLGSHTFEPRWLTSLATLAMLALLVSLGRWQLHRAAQKQLLFDAFARGDDAPLPLDGATPAVPRYRRVQAKGHYDSTHQVLIDNMVSDEQAGYYVITPFSLDGGGWVWVNRGWVPVGRSRRELPDVAVSESERTIVGRADHLPAPGIKLGTNAPLAPPYPVVAAFPSASELGRLVGGRAWTRATETILLDPQAADGFVRKWSAPGLPPLRHIGYAVQWFGLAAALVVIYAVTNTRKAGGPAR